MTSADTVYDNRPWNEQPPAWAYTRPWAGNEEMLCQQALNAALIPGAELQKLVRPPLPQLQLFPPRFGYRTTAPGILDVLSETRGVNASTATSGGMGGYSGASRNSLGQV